MKAATVEELRDQQAAAWRWVKAGEEVAISHDGVIIARLVPERRKPAGVPDAGERKYAPAYLRDRRGEHVLSAEEVTAILNENKGAW